MSSVNTKLNFGTSISCQNETHDEKKAFNNSGRTYEFIPVDLEYLETAMNEPLPDVEPLDEGSSDLYQSDEIEDDIQSSPSKETVPKEDIKISSFLKLNSSNSKVRNLPVETPIRNLTVIKENPEECRKEDELEKLTEKMNANFDLGIATLPFKTPVKNFKVGKENFLNPILKPTLHMIKNINRQSNVLRTPSLNSASKVSGTPVLIEKKINENFRTPIQGSRLLRSTKPLSTSKIPTGKTTNENFSKICVNGIEYIILKVLGTGGSSVVYQCFDMVSKANKAIKCVTLDSPSSSEGYIKEIEVLRRLQHCDRIIRIYDHALHEREKKLFVVLEMGSADLNQILNDLSRQEKVFPSYLILFYWMEMLYAVQQIHTHGIIHSDLKPANFLIINGRLKLIDFGISSCLQNDSTSVFKTVSEGSGNYISPEALNCEYSSNRGSPNFGKPKYKISYKADVWSLGCILYQFIYKKPPFHHITNPMQKLMTIANPSVKIEYPQNHEIPKKFLETLKKCLVYVSKSRPSVDDLISDYEQFFKREICI